MPAPRATAACTADENGSQIFSAAHLRPAYALENLEVSDAAGTKVQTHVPHGGAASRMCQESALIERHQISQEGSAGADTFVARFMSLLPLCCFSAPLRLLVQLRVATMSASLESHLGRFKPHERRRLMKETAVYAQSFCERMFGGHDGRAQTGEEVLGITVTRVKEGWAGYDFKDGDILFFYYLCRCCRKTMLTLQHAGRGDGIDARRRSKRTTIRRSCSPRRRPCIPGAAPEPGSVPGFRQEQNSRTKKLKGKLRAYASGFPKYGAEGWDEQQIAKSCASRRPALPNTARG